MSKKQPIELTEKNSYDLSSIQNWFAVEEEIVYFIMHAKPSTFKFLFGEIEGERLWNHFVMDCERKFHLFKPYLMHEQLHKLLINIVHLEKHILYTQ